jgi:RNA polymerase sigma factor (sigma-70 family)
MRSVEANPRHGVPERAVAASSLITPVPLVHTTVVPTVDALRYSILDSLPPHSPSSEPGLDGEATVELAGRARSGDEAALEALCVRCLKSLSRYAAGRLPPAVRDVIDTQDVVLEAVHRGMSRLSTFECRYPGALLAYMRTILRNVIIDHVRARRRQPPLVPLDDRQPDPGQSPLERVLDGEQIALYEAALARLRPRDAALVTLRIEGQLGYQQIAVELGLPTGNAARVAASRAVLRLAQEMSRLSPAKIEDTQARTL